MMLWQCFVAVAMNKLCQLIDLFVASVGAAVQRELKPTMLYDEYQGQVQLE